MGNAFVKKLEEIPASTYEKLSAWDYSASADSCFRKIKYFSNEWRSSHTLYGIKLNEFEISITTRTDRSFFVNLARPKIEHIEFFSNAFTQSLEITDRKVNEYVIYIYFKKVNFQDLIVKFKDDYSGRVVGSLTRNRKNIRSVKVIWKGGCTDIESAKNALLKFPLVKVYRIHASCGIICDETLVHIAKNSEFAELTGISTITPSGLADTFELVIASQKKGVWCSVARNVIQQWIDQLECTKFLISSSRVMHLESGAYLLYYPADAGYPEDTYFVNMHTARNISDIKQCISVIH